MSSRLPGGSIPIKVKREERRGGKGGKKKREKKAEKKQREGREKAMEGSAWVADGDSPSLIPV